MTSIGETLRCERVRRNLELGQIADQLKISRRFLEAIESEKFDQLPGGVFAKSFVRQYATVLGLDAEDLSMQVERLLAPPPVETAPEAGPAKEHIPEIRVHNMEAWQSVGRRHGSWSSSWITAGGLVVLAMVACSFVYWWWWERPASPKQAHQNSAPVARVAPPTPAPAPPPATPATPPEATPATTPPATVPAPVPAAGTPIAGAPETAAAASPPESNPIRAVHVVITANKPVWIRATGDGKYLFSGTLNENQARTFDADGVVELRVGNAGGAAITLNGKPVSVEGFAEGIIGPEGQVRTLQMTPEGSHLAVPPKSPDQY